MNPYREPAHVPPPPPKCEGDSACHGDVRYAVWHPNDPRGPLRMCGECTTRYRRQFGWSSMRFHPSDPDGRNTRFA